MASPVASQSLYRSELYQQASSRELLATKNKLAAHSLMLYYS